RSKTFASCPLLARGRERRRGWCRGSAREGTASPGPAWRLGRVLARPPEPCQRERRPARGKGEQAEGASGIVTARHAGRSPLYPCPNPPPNTDPVRMGRGFGQNVRILLAPAA